jgi:predicted GTPase
MNFIAIGTSGVGKSTLINEIFGEQIAKEGMGTRTTLESKKYESKLVPFLSVLDTMGTEIGSGHRLIDVLQETLQQITQKLNSNDPNEHIHCILYCTTSNRFFPDELDVILKLREKYDGKKITYSNCVH